MRLRPIASLRNVRGILALSATMGASMSACRDAVVPAAAHSAPVVEGEVQLAPDSPKRSALVIEVVRPATERVVGTLPAQVAPDEGHTVRVTSPVTGRIMSLDVMQGDHVRRGQPLAHIRSVDAVQATSDASKALAVWTAARGTLARTTDLFEHKVSSARELDLARSDESQAHAEYERTQARSKQLGIEKVGVSDTYVLRAPGDGVVVDRTANTGTEVRPDMGQPLFTISALDVVWLAVSVPQRDLAQVHRGARIRFRTESVPARSFDGTISFVSDALDPASRTATARAVLANPGGALRMQATGEAQLLVTDQTDAMSIPTRALVTHGTSTVVFVETSPSHFVRRVVTVRDDDGTTATIATGLASGDRVVTTGSLLLSAEADRAH